MIERERVLRTSMSTLKSMIMWVIGIGAVLLFMAACLNLELFPVRLAY